jgi:hypothetical protein
MYRAFPGADYYGGSVSVRVSWPHTSRTPRGSAHTFPCCVCHRHRVEVDALFPPVPAPCRLDRLDVPFPTWHAAPYVKRVIPLRLQTAGKRSLTHSPSVWGESKNGGGSTERSLAFVMSTLSLAVREWAGLPSGSACSQGFRPRGVSHPSPAWSGSRVRRDVAPFRALRHTLLPVLWVRVSLLVGCPSLRAGQQGVAR